MKNLLRYFTGHYAVLAVIVLSIIVSCTKTTVAPKSSAKDMVSFAIILNDKSIPGTINGNAISVVVPFGTPLTSLVPVIQVSAAATVTGDGTPTDFTGPVNYVVTAEDGSQKTYTVTVLAGKSPLKVISSFSFNGLTPAVNGKINDTTYAISLAVPNGTNVTALVPTIAVSDKATVSPASGTAQDFSKEVDYTVTAEDGSKQVYKVTTTIAIAVPQVIDCGNIPSVLTDRGPGIDYIVQCNLTISGTQTLTINPGVTIQFQGRNTGINVTGQASLTMSGTASQPIVLEGQDGSPGSWIGVQVSSTGNFNQWNYVTIKDAGATYNTGLYLTGVATASSVSLQNCTITNNNGYGILDDDRFYSGNHLGTFKNNSITNNTLSAMAISAAEINSLDGTSTYVNNGQAYIEINQLSPIPNINVTVNKLDANYRIMGSLRIEKLLTIMPGVTIEFAADAGINSGYSDPASVIANGTSSSPIKFVGYLPNVKGIWNGLNLGGTNAQTSLTYCVIDGAGSGDDGECSGYVKAALTLGSDGCGYPGRGKITNCTISNSAGYGITYKNGDPVTVSGINYSGNTLGNVYLQ